eukprot:5931272-Prymnesium_polylepis.1
MFASKLEAAVAYARHDGNDTSDSDDLSEAADRVLHVESGAPEAQAAEEGGRLVPLQMRAEAEKSEAAEETLAYQGTEVARLAVVEEAEGLALHLSERSATGYLGVYQKGRRFEARRNGNGKYIKLGMFASKLEAAV